MRENYQGAELVICWLGESKYLKKVRRALTKLERIGPLLPAFDPTNPTNGDVDWWRLRHVPGPIWNGFSIFPFLVLTIMHDTGWRNHELQGKYGMHILPFSLLLAST